MILEFFKFHGTGNDFILIDNRAHLIQKYTDNESLIKQLCDRHFGIGADGLILLNNKIGYDFEMIYYNADGFIGSMCGNGGRCAVAFANMLNIIHNKAIFFVNDIIYKAQVVKKRGNNIYVSLNMQDVDDIKVNKNFTFLNTGSPHYVCFVENINELNVFEEGRKIRFSKSFESIGGTNVNFVNVNNEQVYVKTYERGVEAETLSCGTGAVASAIASYINGFSKNSTIDVKTRGGDLKIRFKYLNNVFTDIFLEGPATYVFKGEIDI